MKLKKPMKLMKPKQLSFNKNPAFKDHLPRFEHGGGLRKGKRKLSRPFDSKKTLHVTLRSKRAKGQWSFLKSHHEKQLLKLVYNYADHFDVRIFRFANSGNHLHLLLKSTSKRGFQNFLRTIAGRIARTVTGAERGRAKGKFWEELAYSKLIGWGKQFSNTSNYVLKNTLEAFGIIPPRSQARGHLRIDFQELFLRT